MKIKVISMVACPPWNLSALPGDIIEVENKQGAELVELKRAVKIESENIIKPKPIEPVEPKPTVKKTK